MNEELKKMIKDNSYPKVQFSKEQLSNMRKVDLIDFMTWYDKTKIIQLKGNTRLTDNNSVVLNSIWAIDFGGDNHYYTAIDFCIKFLDLSTYGAMYVLNEYLKCDHTHAQSIPRLIPIETIESRIANQQYIPADKVKPIYAYLCKTRQIPTETVRKFIKEDYIYAEQLKNGYNLLFPIYNSYDDIIGFERAGILSHSEHRFKGCIISEAYTGYTYQHKYITGAEEITIAFESGIDLMSFVALADEGLIKLPDNKSIILLSLRGLQGKVLERYTQKQDVILLCVDNDKAGELFYTAEHNKYDRMIYGSSVLDRYSVKDWNDLLKVKEKIKTPINFQNITI